MLFRKESFMFTLQVASPLNGIFKLLAAVLQNLDSLGIGKPYKLLICNLR